MTKLLRACVFLLSHVPPKAGYQISRNIARLLRALDTDPARTTRINLAVCFPDKDLPTRAALALESLTQMVLLVFEFSYLVSWPKQRLLDQISEVQGRHLLDAAWQDERGILILMPHFGHWELMGTFLGEHYSFCALYDPPRMMALDSLMSTTRERHGGEMFPLNGGGLRRLMKVLRSGGLGLLLPDQVPARGAGAVASTFFGQPVQSISLSHRIVQKTDPHVLMLTVARVIGREGIQYVAQLTELEGAGAGADAQTHVDAINRAIEAVVKQAPEQYQWEYKRFKRPPGELGKHNIYRCQ
jgi:KDO2-lipid IV(A) lauroyltransferase